MWRLWRRSVDLCRGDWPRLDRAISLLELLNVPIPLLSLVFASGELFRGAVGSAAGVIVVVEGVRENGLPTPRCVPLSSERSQYRSYDTPGIYALCVSFQDMAQTAFSFLQMRGRSCVDCDSERERPAVTITKEWSTMMSIGSRLWCSICRLSGPKCRLWQ